MFISISIVIGVFFVLIGSYFIKEARAVLEKQYLGRLAKIEKKGAVDDQWLPFIFTIKGWHYLPGNPEEYRLFLDDVIPATGWVVWWIRIVGMFSVSLGILLPVIVAASV